MTLDGRAPDDPGARPKRAVNASGACPRPGRSRDSPHPGLVLKALPDEGGEGQGCALFGGSLVYAQDLLDFMEAVTDGVDMYGELVGYGLS